MIVGHQKQLQFLRYMVQTDQLPHALLFSGEEQLGKRKVAVELAKTLHCQAPCAPPCQKCSACFSVDRGVYRDLLLAEPQDKEIKIEQIRRVVNFFSLRSASGKPKFVIIDNAHRMTVPAQQAFLKTLEEPAGNAVIIMVTSKPHLLLPTVLSRVQQLKFFPVSERELIGFLQTKGLSENAAKGIIKLSLGRPGAVMEFLADKKNLKRRAYIFKKIQELCRADLPERFQWVRDTSREPRNIPETLELWLRFFRGLAIMKLRGSVINRRSATGQEESGGSLAFSAYSLERLRRIMATLQEVEFAVSNSKVNPRLALDVLVMEL